MATQRNDTEDLIKAINALCLAVSQLRDQWAAAERAFDRLVVELRTRNSLSQIVAQAQKLTIRNSVAVAILSIPIAVIAPLFVASMLVAARDPAAVLAFVAGLLNLLPRT